MGKTSKRQRKIGICDIENACGDTCYNVWVSMIGRCYTTNTRPRDKSYIGCEVCQDWLTYSNFHNWFYDPNNGYVKGYNLDKDIISKGNKIYSPSTCCFIPQELNKVFTKRKSRRGEFPIGVIISKSGKYDSRIKINKRDYYLGAYTTIEEAFNAYKNAKERHIHNVAEKYFQEGKITEKVYNALMKYEVEITD